MEGCRRGRRDVFGSGFAFCLIEDGLVGALVADLEGIKTASREGAHFISRAGRETTPPPRPTLPAPLKRSTP